MARQYKSQASEPDVGFGLTVAQIPVCHIILVCNVVDKFFNPE